MKRLLWWLLLAAGVVSLMMVAGCDEDDNPLSPDSEDPEFLMFEEQFEEMDDITSLMFDVSFEVVDIFLNPQAGKAAIDFSYSVEWDASSQYWIVTIEVVNTEDSTSFSAIDSIQFRYASGPVQEPVEDSVTGITNRLYMTVIDTAATGAVFQILEITKEDLEIDTLMVSGTGGIDLTGEWTEIEETDTTECSVDLNYTITAVDLKVGGSSENDDCPVSGMVQYLGTIDLECVGATTGSLIGSWTVTQTFNYGTITTVVSHGDNQWSGTDTCE